MDVHIREPHTGKSHEYSGADDTVRSGLLRDFRRYLYPGILDPYDLSLSDIIELLNAQQVFLVDVKHSVVAKSEHHGMLSALHKDKDNEFFKAASLLTGKPVTATDTIKRLIYQADGNTLLAALRAYGLVDNEANRQSILSLIALGVMKKNEHSPVSGEVEFAVPEGKATSEAVSRAIQGQLVEKVDLHGKHSQGSLIATDPETGKKFLLKPGA